MDTLLTISILVSLIYGEYLLQTCPNCRNEECDTNGQCLNGCEGSRWGNYCQLSCGSYCGACNQTSGVCFGCSTGYWGSNCLKHCPDVCPSKRCSQSNGSCLYCYRGRWGKSCENICSEFCHHLSCEYHTGRCLNGCERGRYGDTCHLWCNPGCSGDLCLQNGSCVSGCKEQFYGHNCEKRCSSNCLPPYCNKHTGICSACRTGFYGQFCTNICSRNCVNKTCSLKEGFCTHGCENEWTGNQCDVTSEVVPSTINAALVISICLGLLLTIFILILIIKRYQRKCLPRFCCPTTASNPYTQDVCETCRDKNISTISNAEGPDRPQSFASSSSSYANASPVGYNVSYQTEDDQNYDTLTEGP
ncbi:scavenger receptor class F member 1-like [Saccostrea cucullata]|uniref:scavenger receptor class F member 1-like n=1 Tax=Saccostrea cuccullata TaxID=36930 RepID=UPI002ED63741